MVVDVIDFEERLEKYKVVILPDSILLDDNMTNKIKEFTKNGGKVLATGISGVDTGKSDYTLDFVSYVLPKLENHQTVILDLE